MSLHFSKIAKVWVRTGKSQKHVVGGGAVRSGYHDYAKATFESNQWHFGVGHEEKLPGLRALRETGAR